ncbi:hypothetical protein [Acidocella sp. MX-AZ02]|uniref:hypothetical protein n=1 Tax=Acidocella sp. MX-AZ02 TaxID=1214225 RepID=UPI000588066D|nr:hypothetical protein [Acidocella sp. MX-AZ02]
MASIFFIASRRLFWRALLNRLRGRTAPAAWETSHLILSCAIPWHNGLGAEMVRLAPIFARNLAARVQVRYGQWRLLAETI